MTKRNETVNALAKEYDAVVLDLCASLFSHPDRSIIVAAGPHISVIGPMVDGKRRVLAAREAKP